MSSSSSAASVVGRPLTSSELQLQKQQREQQLAILHLQQQKQQDVDEHVSKLGQHYKALLKRFSAALAEPQTAPGRHEELAVQSSAENIVVHVQRLQDIVQDLRMQTIIMYQHQFAQTDEKDPCDGES